MKKYVIIVAGGKGERMNSSVPKQFLPLNGKPLLMHTMERIYSCDLFDQPVVLVLPSGQINYWQRLCKTFYFNIPHIITEGGETRFHSVKNGLQRIPEDSLVGVHDGVRPLISSDVIINTFSQALKYEAVVPVISLQESLRKIEKSGHNNFPVSRDEYVLVQTPQVFKSDLLKNAYQTPFIRSFTDDASVVEHYGYKIHMVEGNRENIKLTTLTDLKWAETYLQQKTG
ncbi:MAG: 2-C-methyl-D-erythritol 4-phosphate cytidylyltransferase [Bacteroidales bacterium]|nr:2-C-methyl-D-erythritol 4-phosphate cytidylyltransferase [Bacteroidales bacterium]MCF8332742.1 2-C-methyl-D-erythritol 4-phosphate cytidylyltransferase [Bacteroidales bacterium]